MPRLLLALALVLAVPVLSEAAPCVPDSLDAYLALGSGCEIDGVTLFDFSAAASFFGGTEISSTLILVTPVSLPTGAGLDFALSGRADATDLLGVAIGFTVSGLPFVGAGLDVTGSAAANDGVLTVVEDMCLGDTFVVDPGFCFSGDTRSMIFAHDAVGPTGPDSSVFASSFLDVFVDLTIDGGLSGSASLGDSGNPGIISTMFTTETTTVPEPSVMSLLGSGLFGLWTVRRRKRFFTPR